MKLRIGGLLFVSSLNQTAVHVSICSLVRRVTFSIPELLTQIIDNKIKNSYYAEGLVGDMIRIVSTILVAVILHSATMGCLYHCLAAHDHTVHSDMSGTQIACEEDKGDSQSVALFLSFVEQWTGLSQAIDFPIPESMQLLDGINFATFTVFKPILDKPPQTV